MIKKKQQTNSFIQSIIVKLGMYKTTKTQV